MKKLRRPAVSRDAALLVIAAAAFTIWAWAFIRRTSLLFDGRRYYCLFDDAMISMQYAWNLAHGRGLVWNPGERVEGITNLLTTLSMAVFARLFDRSGAVFAVQLSGIATMLALGWLCARIGVELRRHREGDVVAPSVADFCAALVYYPLNYWSLLGMETGHLALLTAAALWLALRDRFDPRFSAARAVIVGLVSIVRPDALIVVALVLAYRASLARGRRGVARAVAREAAIALCLPAAATLFRLAYYGRLLPNTVTLKMAGIPLGVRLANGAGFIKPFLSTIWIPAAFAVWACLRRPSRERLLLVGLFATSVLYQVWIGGDPWPLWRHQAPFVPLLFLVCLDEVRRMVGAAAAARDEPGAGGATTDRRRGLYVAGALLCAALPSNAGFYKEFGLREQPYHTYFNVRNVRRGLVLSEVLGPRASVGVFWAGAVVYYSRRRGVDFLGKCDAYVASLPPDLSGAVQWSGMTSVPGHNKYDLEYSIGVLRPTFVETFRWGRQDLTASAGARYRFVRYKGATLWLLADSPDVRWERLPAK
jgi:hypothetical protein